MDTCALCRKPGTNQSPINRHHVQGRKKGVHLPIMRVHAQTCHRFAEWITQTYIAAGRETELTSETIIYLFNRFTTLRGEPFEVPFG